MFCLFQLIAAFLAVDFLSGIFHWLIDNYGSQDTPFIGKYIIQPNILHHTDPKAFTLAPFWKRNQVTGLMSLLILISVYLLGFLNGFWLSFCCFGLLTNEIHCWSHRSKRENGRVIRFLQKLRIIQTPKHHGQHHKKPNDQAYCSMTNWLNPILDKLQFFRCLEKAIIFVFGIYPRQPLSSNSE